MVVTSESIDQACRFDINEGGLASEMGKIRHCSEDERRLVKKAGSWLRASSESSRSIGISAEQAVLRRMGEAAASRTRCGFQPATGASRFLRLVPEYGRRYAEAWVGACVEIVAGGNSGHESYFSFWDYPWMPDAAVVARQDSASDADCPFRCHPDGFRGRSAFSQGRWL